MGTFQPKWCVVLYALVRPVVFPRCQTNAGTRIKRLRNGVRVQAVTGFLALATERFWTFPGDFRERMSLGYMHQRQLLS